MRLSLHKPRHALVAFSPLNFRVKTRRQSASIDASYAASRARHKKT
jgi:hypothetical protein